MFDPTRLSALVAVAEAGSITHAAARLGYTAPALSQQLAKLEREAGATLLVRHHRGGAPYGRGRAAGRARRRVLDEMDQARHELTRLAGLSGGRLRVGTFTTAGVHLLPPVLSAFRRAHPDVELTVADYEPPDGIAAVAAGEVDLALTHAYAGVRGAAAVRPLRRTAAGRGAGADHGGRTDAVRGNGATAR